MADTAHKTADELVEHQDAPDVLVAKVKALAARITNAKYFVTWTGAGVSTSAGVPDFRGPNGKWTLAAKGAKPDPKIKTTSTLAATPSLTHMSIVQLLNQDLMKFLISTNTDGLHRRSGVPAAKISELHGNGNRVRCEKCTQAYMKDDRVRVAAKVHDHSTGLKCLACGGDLNDTIINFNEYLAPEVQKEANRHGRKADVLLVLGSSLRVITCNALEDIQSNKGDLIVVNKQITPYDSACSIRIFADCDTVMMMLMTELGLPIPPPNLTRYLTLDWAEIDTKGTLTFQGYDETFKTPFAICAKGAEVKVDKDVKSTAKHDTEWHKPLKFTGLKDCYAKSKLVMKMNPLRNENDCVIDLAKVFADGAKVSKNKCKMIVQMDHSTKDWAVQDVQY
jgi:NAD-dependent SIR2 family protein deacetylase